MLTLKNSLPWNFSLYWIYALHSGFLSNLRLQWKTELPWKFSLYWNIFYHSGISNLRLPWKTECALNSLYWTYIFYHSGFLSNLHLHWKTELPWKFSLHSNIFYHSGILSNLRLPWKQEFALKFFKPGGLPPLRLCLCCTKLTAHFFMHRITYFLETKLLDIPLPSTLYDYCQWQQKPPWAFQPAVWESPA